MMFKKLIIVTILCVLGLVPALSFAQGCCCIKNASHIAAIEKPCHDTQASHSPAKICLCDAGLSSAPATLEQTQFYTPVAHIASQVFEPHQPTLIKRSITPFRPPIAFS